MPATALESKLADMYEEVELRLLAEVAKRLKTDAGPGDWQLAKLLELQALKKKAAGEMKPVLTEAMKGVNDLLKERYEGGADLTWSLFEAYMGGSGTEAFKAFDKAVLSKELIALITEQQKGLETSSQFILRNIEDRYRQIVAEVSAPGMLLGAETRATAVQNALNKFADQGITGFVDKGGRKWEMRAYVEMATGTAAHRASTQGHLDSLKARGHDLVRVSDHKGECERCRKWEGKILSISGVVEDTSTLGEVSALIGGTVEQARADGLEHPGCRHRYTAYFPGISGPQTPQGKPADYDLRTEQRGMERQVRAWKRRAAVGDPKAPAYVQKWQKKLRDHVEKHGLKRRYDREQLISGKTGTFSELKAGAPKPVATPRPVATTKPVATPVAEPIAVKPLPGIAEQISELKQKLANVNPASPWGKKYAKDLAALEEIQDAYSSTAKKLSALTNPDSPWAKKYAKDLDDMMSAYLTPKTQVTATVKPPPVPKPAPVTPPKAYVPPAKVALATSKGEAFWKGKAQPRKPDLAVPVKPSGPGPVVFDGWVEKAKKRFADFAAKTGNPKNDLTKSLNWNYFKNVTDSGDTGALKYLIDNKYIDQDMYDEALLLIKKATTPTGEAGAAYEKALAAWKASQDQFQIDIKDWRRANGIPDPRLRGFENAVRHSDNYEGTSWANKNLSTAPAGKSALTTYTGGSYSSWNAALRQHNGVLPQGSQWYQKTIDADKGFLPSPVDLVVNRGTSRSEFVFNGVRGGMDPMDLVGTVQEAHGYTSTSVGRTAAFGGEIEMKIMVPKDYPVAWVDPFSQHKGERELILKRGSKFFVHKVTESGGGYSKKWVLEVEVLMDDVDPSILGPADVMPADSPFA